ncbi:UNKNOWN [Stylonychia lemnae]|uniref:Uncharacterized protein n=1 Tax=Stylonychia lemnae TaxID=5949 RepID=A0A077ZW17_STYLE|nr:UNKNOWN [Stylonychia lemnae]|eukprot:CDW72636.1 UNKNOWN [Stylonychia lemnae]
MIKQSKRRNKFLTDLTKLRLELFYFDEKVQIATFSLPYLESHQGSGPNFPEYMSYFDFGKPQEQIIQESTYYRGRLASSNFDQSLENYTIMKRQASFLFREYLAPDQNEIDRALLSGSDSYPINEQHCQQASEFQQVQQDQIFENQNQDDSKEIQKQIEHKYVEKSLTQQFRVQSLIDENSAGQKKSFDLINGPHCNQFVAIQQRDDLNTIDDIPSNTQIDSQPSVYSLKSDSGSSLDANVNGSEFDDQIFLDHLNVLTSDSGRVLLSQKKLFKNKEIPSRKCSIIQEDDFLRLPTLCEIKRQSMHQQRDSKSRNAIDLTETGKNRRYQRRGTKYERSRFRQLKPDSNLEKIKQQLMNPSWKNKQNEQYLQRKECFNKLRKIGTKLRGNVNLDLIVNKLNNQSSADKNYNQQQQYGGYINQNNIIEDITEVNSPTASVTINDSSTNNHRLNTNQKEYPSESFFRFTQQQTENLEPQTAIPKNMVQKNEGSMKIDLEEYVREKLKNNSSPTSPKIHLKERIETVYIRSKNYQIKTKRSTQRNNNNNPEYSKYRFCQASVEDSNISSNKNEASKEQSFLDDSYLQKSMISSNQNISNDQSNLQSKPANHKSFLKDLKQQLQSIETLIDTNIPMNDSKSKSFINPATYSKRMSQYPYSPRKQLSPIKNKINNQPKHDKFQLIRHKSTINDLDQDLNEMQLKLGKILSKKSNICNQSVIINDNTPLRRSPAKQSAI